MSNKLSRRLIIPFFALLLTFGQSYLLGQGSCENPGNFSFEITNCDDCTFDEDTNTFTVSYGTNFQFTSDGVDPTACEGDPLCINPGLIIGVYSDQPSTTNPNDDPNYLFAQIINLQTGVLIADNGDFDITTEYIFEECGEYILVPLFIPNVDGVVLLETCTAVDLKLNYPTVNIPCEESCDGVPGGDAFPGTPCDDENAQTINDTWTDECECVGEDACANFDFGFGYECSYLCDEDTFEYTFTIEVGDNNVPYSATITVDGELYEATSEEDPFQITITGGASLGSVPAEVSNILGCSVEGQLGDVSCGSIDIDCDQDGVFVQDDCDDDDPDLGAPQDPGTECDDNNPTTENDMIMEDGCTCLGTPIGDCNDFMSDLQFECQYNCDLGVTEFYISAVAEGGNGGPYVISGTVTTNEGDLVISETFDTQVSFAQEFDPSSSLSYDIDITDLEECSMNFAVEDFECDFGIPDCDEDGVLAGEDCDDLDPEVGAIQEAGTECDDNNPNTIEDVIQEDGCTCAGTLVIDECEDAGGDADEDGVCADIDCDDNDAEIGAQQEAGTECDDNNPDTIEDVIQEDGCSCAGTLVIDECEDAGGDADEDGVCADIDCDDNDAEVGAQQEAGTECDDNNPDTIEDVIQEDGCSCEGTLVIDECEDAGGDADEDGVCADFDCDDNDADIGAQQEEGTSCDDGNEETIDDVILEDGCSCQGTLVIDECADAGGDADEDGVCANFDCDDNDADVGAQQAPGTACDDNNPDTFNDIIQADGCSCLGQEEVECELGAIGSISTDSPTTICTLDDIVDPIIINWEGSEATESGFIIIDDTGKIISNGILPGPSFDLNGVGFGSCTIYGISFISPIFGDVVNNDLTDITGCFEFTNGITITKNEMVTITIDGNCDNDTGVYTMIVQATGGAPNGSYTFSGDINGTYTEAEANAGVIIDFEDGDFYSFTVDDGAGCGTSLSGGPIVCVKTAIELVRFDGLAQGNDNLLSWTTGTETNNDYFVLERSVDAQNFEAIAQINGAGNSQHSIDYEWLDEAVGNKDYYYRLTAVDFDGNDDRSEIVFIERAQAATGDLQFYPIPVADLLQVSGLDHNERALYKVYNGAGQLVLNGPVTNSSIDCTTLSSGLYFVEIQAGAKRWFQRISKQ